jgi:hypothetical protein
MTGTGGNARAVHLDNAVDEPCRSLTVGDTVVGGEQVGVFGLAQFGDEGILLTNSFAPVVQFGLGVNSDETCGRASVVKRLGGPDERLRRHAADIDAGAADGAAADERHLRALIGGRDGSREASRTGADHNGIEGGSIATVRAVGAVRDSRALRFWIDRRS